MPKPVVAAVNGVAAGAGAGFAFAADVRILAESAGFNTAFIGIALSADSGSTWWLPRLVGAAKAKELLLMPRTVGAQEALDLGLATEVRAGRRPRGPHARGGGAAGRGSDGRPAARPARRSRNSLAHPLEESLAHEGQLYGADRRDGRPPGSGDGIPGEGEADLRGPLTPSSPLIKEFPLIKESVTIISSLIVTDSLINGEGRFAGVEAAVEVVVDEAEACIVA